MRITISGRHLELSDALRVHVTERLGVVIGKYFDHAQEARVTFDRVRGGFACDIRMHPGRDLEMQGEGEGQTAHAAFDAAAEHAAKQLRRFRRRMNEHNRDLANRERAQPVG